MKRLAIAWLMTLSVASGAAAQITFTPAGSIKIQAESVKVQDGIAFVAAGRTLSLFDVKDPAAPKALGSHTFDQEIWAFRLHGKIAYVGINFAGLGILDVSNPSTPVLRGAFKTPGQAKVGAIFGNRALVVDHMEGLVEVNVGDPAKPTSPGSFFLDGYARDVVTAGPLAFAVDSPTGLYVFDLSKTGPLEPIASVQNGTALRNIEVVPGTPATIVALGGGTLQLYDVSNPASPRRLQPFKTAGGATRVAFRDRMAYVADGAAGLTLVDLTNPAAPAIVGTHKMPAAVRDVAVGDGIVLVAVASGEVIVLKESR